MSEADFNETKAVAHLPSLDIEIYHRRPWQGSNELLTITLRAVPSFDAFFRALEATNPLLFWMRAVETMWAPYLPRGEPVKPAQLTQAPRPSNEG
jgi:hypothetical protein